LGFLVGSSLSSSLIFPVRFLMCDVFPFASIDSSCFGFRVSSSLSSSLIFQCVFLMCDVFPFASIDSGCFGFRVGSSLSIFLKVGLKTDYIYIFIINVAINQSLDFRRAIFLGSTANTSKM
jgi:hypothetical protein